ncbi:DB module family protein [Acanthocheilonema viteae]
MKWYQAYAISLSLSIATLEIILAGNANKRFMNCCNRRSDINEWCKTNLCTFSITSEQALTIFPLCTQFGNTMMNIWQCANANYNHSKCCAKKGIPTNCRSYCNGKPMRKIMNIKCFYYFSQILSCFKEYYEKQ